MTLELRSIIAKGDLQKERLTFRAKSDLDIGDFCVLQCALIEEVLTTTVENAYWFAFKNIKAGDLVVLYTKSGFERSKVLDEGRSAHFYYWGKASAIWENSDTAAVLLESPRWTYKAADEL